MATADWKDWQMLSCKNKYRAKLIAQKHNKKKNKPNNFSALKINQRQNTIWKVFMVGKLLNTEWEERDLEHSGLGMLPSSSSLLAQHCGSARMRKATRTLRFSASGKRGLFYLEWQVILIPRLWFLRGRWVGEVNISCLLVWYCVVRRQAYS